MAKIPPTRPRSAPLSPEEFGVTSNEYQQAIPGAHAGRSHSFDVGDAVHHLSEINAYPRKVRTAEEGRLFNLNDVARPEPHQQTQDEFDHDSRTWWHGRNSFAPYPEPNEEHGHSLYSVTSVLPKKKFADSQFYERQAGAPSVHVGTYRASLVRATGTVNRFYPGRVPESRFENTPWDPKEDPGTSHLNRGDKKGVYYRNSVEDPGSITAEIPSAKSFKSWRSSVTQAKREGKHVRRAVDFDYGRSGGAQGPHYDPNLTFTQDRGWNADEPEHEQQQFSGLEYDWGQDSRSRIHTKGYNWGDEGHSVGMHGESPADDWSGHQPVKQHPWPKEAEGVGSAKFHLSETHHLQINPASTAEYENAHNVIHAGGPAEASGHVHAEGM